MNQTIFSFLYGFAHRSAALDALYVFVATDLVWVVAIAVFFFLLKNKDRRVAFRDIIVVLSAAAAGAIASSLFKNIFDTVRPFAEMPLVQSLIPESGYAFPSGHTTDLMAISAALWRDHRRASAFVAVAVLLVGMARVVVGVHWPIDILGGIVLGGAVGVGVNYLVQRLLQNNKKSLY